MKISLFELKFSELGKTKPAFFCAKKMNPLLRQNFSNSSSCKATTTMLLDVKGELALITAAGSHVRLVRCHRSTSKKICSGR